MPSGKVHTANTITAAGLIAASSYFLDPALVSNADVSILTFGCLSGIFISSDLDVNKGYIGLYYLRLIPVVGPIVSLLWKWYWKPYSLIIPHRDWISHTPGISTIIRMGYVSWPWLLIFSISLAALNWHYLFIYWLGLTISDTFHVVADLFDTHTTEE